MHFISLFFALLIFLQILEAKPIPRSQYDPTRYSIKLGVFADIDNVHRLERRFAQYDTVAVAYEKRTHFYITNLKDKQRAKSLLQQKIKPLFKDAYLIKPRKQQQKRELPKGKQHPATTTVTTQTASHVPNNTRSISTPKVQNYSVLSATKLRENNISSVKSEKIENNNTISLKEAILISLNRSRKILSLREKVVQQKYKVEEKRGAFLPNITLYSTGGYEYIHTRSDRESEDRYPKADAQLNLTENIYAGGKHQAELKREEAKLFSESANFREKVEEETLKIIEAYLNLYYQSKAIEIERKNMAALQKILDIVKIKEESGATTKGDLNNIKSSVENASTALVKASSRFQNALAFYRYFLGEKASARKPEKGDFSFPTYSHETLMSIFEKKNAKLLSNRYKIEAQKFDYRARKAPFRPTIDLIVTGKEKFSKGVADPFHDEKASAVLSLNYNLYKGGQDRAKLLSSKSKVAQLEYQYIDILESTRYNLEQLFENIRSIDDTLIHIQKEVEANEKAVASYWDAFKYGTQDMQTLLLAQRALNRSQQDLLKDKKEYILSHFKLLAQSGELLEYLKITDFVSLERM